MKKYLLLFFICLSHFAFCKVWQVGPTRTYKVPSAVASLVANGDTVEIDAGLYADCAVWNNNNLLLEGVGGYAHIDNTVCQSKGIWVLYGTHITVENIEFSGAWINTSLGENAAGIRAQGGSFTIRHCYFHNNQDGILESPADTMTDILVENSVFEYNGVDTGSGAGFEHNMYIGHARSFILRYSYTHGALVGHNIKTRAYKNYILYNRISDNSDGTASRDIDIPNGGQAVIMGNIIEKGPKASNSNSLEFGLEGLTNPAPQDIYIINNTFIDDKPSGCSFIDLQTGTDTLKVFNNIFAGSSTFLISSPTVLDSATNMTTASILYAAFVNAAGYNYNLMASSPAINKGSYAGSFDTLVLTPKFEYVDSANTQARVIAGKVDIGAYEYNPTAAINELQTGNNLVVKLERGLYGNTSVYISNLNEKKAYISVSDISGRELLSETTCMNRTNINTSSLASGIYVIKVIANDNFWAGKFILTR
jgi:hypothetical protein